MAVRSSSDILSFFCMLQFSGKKLSTRSLKSRRRRSKRAEKLRGEEAALVKPPVYLQHMYIPRSCRVAAAVQLSSLGGRTPHTVSLEAGRRAGLHVENAGKDVGGFHLTTPVVILVDGHGGGLQDTDWDLLVDPKRDFFW